MGVWNLSPLNLNRTQKHRVPLNLNLQEICNESVKYDPTCVAAGNEGGHVAVGDNDKNVHVYKFGGNGFEEVKTLSLLGQVYISQSI